MKIKYVGVKQDGETAFSPTTGITWFPGMVEEVASAIAVKMIQHPDVFERVEDGAAPTAPAALTPVAAAIAKTNTTPPADDGILLGSDVLPALVDIGEKKVQLGEIVASAFKRSGLTAHAWNGMAADEREEFLTLEISMLTNQAPVEYAITTPEGKHIVLDDMDADALRALSTELGLKPHHAAGAKSLSEKLVAAFPEKK